MDDEKKTERKKRRFAARLKTTKGILCTEDKKPNLVICNAGQATGLQKNAIIRLVSNLSNDFEHPKFVAEKGETYSFLSFSSVELADKFHEAYNGKAKINESANPLYLSFVESVPNTDIICPYDNPEGLLVINDFITTEEEEIFFRLFDWTDEKESNLKNRQVKHYGYEFRYGSNDVDLRSPLQEKIPEECDVLWRRLRKRGLDITEPDQLTVNKYAPGQGIPSHVDKHSPFGGIILSLSLGSAVVMDWKHPTGKYVPVLVDARSMLVMQGAARYDWQHGIQPRLWDPIIEHRISEGAPVKVITGENQPRGIRISLTFRWTRSGPCNCEYETLCDSAVKEDDNSIGDDVASRLEELHVHEVYEQIAGHFSSTRHTPWPRVVEFLASRVAPGAVVLDLGAGNGKNVLSYSDIFQVAGERSSGLLEECASHIASRRLPAAQCVRLDLLHCPLVDACADFVICIAVIHHFSSQARRLQAISTISRLLRPGGRALITVWAKDQSKSNYICKNKLQEPSQEQRVTVGGVQLPVHENRTQFQHNDLLVPWKLRKMSKDCKFSSQTDNTLLRYYHVFEEGELDGICKQLPLQVEESYYEEGNWCVVCKKINDST